MKLRIWSPLLVVSALCACGATTGTATPSPTVAAPGATNPALDGRAYEVVLAFPDAPPQKDTLRFANGKFESTDCTTLGFPQWSDYTAQAAGDAIPFHVLAKHPSGTTMDWSGTVKGDAVDGTVHRAMNGKTDVLTFKGSLQP
jgi:hypothetical protein